MKAAIFHRAFSLLKGGALVLGLKIGKPVERIELPAQSTATIGLPADKQCVLNDKPKLPHVRV